MQNGNEERVLLGGVKGQNAGKGHMSHERGCKIVFLVSLERKKFSSQET